MGRAHTSPILDTGMNTELTTNIIAELMWPQCNEDYNEYLLLDLLVDYWKDIMAICIRSAG